MLEKHFARELSDASYACNHEILGLQNVGKSSRRYQEIQYFHILLKLIDRQTQLLQCICICICI